jgi:DNA-binding NarL/FixJ family response regulator
VDDHEPWRRFVRSALKRNPRWQVIGEAADGLAAVHQAVKLKPDLIVLDIGLPTINGIEAVRRIRTQAPQSKVLFLSENRSSDVVEEALRSGGNGYVVKSDAGSELALAVGAVLQGRRFVSSSLAGNRDRPDSSTANRPLTRNAIDSLSPKVGPPPRHEVMFYSDDRQLLDQLTLFIGSAIRAGNAAIVAATESHRASLLPRLQAYGVDISVAIEQGQYLALDAAEALSTFMRNGKPDPDLFMWAFGDLITTAIRTTTVEHPRVAIFGECVDLLCEQGNPEAAVQMEKLGNRLLRIHPVDILCGYSAATRQANVKSELFQRVCAEHSAVHEE